MTTTFTLIDGKTLATTIEQELKNKITYINSSKNNKTRQPCLAVILVGEDPASKIYTSKKAKKCEEVGMLSTKITLPNTISESALIKEITLLNNNPTIDGILVQLPLPKHITPSTIINTIDPKKDVDGFHPLNMGKILLGEQDGFSPCTPLAIQEILKRYNVKTEGQHVVVIGRSSIVGKPIAAILQQNTPGCNATVTITNSYTKNLTSLTKQADILIVAIGKPKFITKNMIKEGAVVIDVGINRIQDDSAPKGYKIVGDTDFENIKALCSKITPVPGGVGPLTVAMVLSNTLKSYQLREKYEI